MGRSTSTIVAARWVLTAVILLCLSVFHRAPAQESDKKGSSKEARQNSLAISRLNVL